MYTISIQQFLWNTGAKIKMQTKISTVIDSVQDGKANSVNFHLPQTNGVF